MDENKFRYYCCLLATFYLNKLIFIMQKFLFLFTAFFLGIFSLTCAQLPSAYEVHPVAQSVDAKADEVLSKYYAAMGGKEKLAQVKTSYMLFEGVQASSGIQITKEEHMRCGEKFHILMKYSGKVVPQIFDGKKISFAGQAVELDAGQIASFKSLTHFAIEPALKKRNFTFKYEGAYYGEFGGADYYRVTATSPDESEVYTFHYNKKNYLKIRTELLTVTKVAQGTRQSRTITNYSDYKPVNGLQVAHTQEVKENGSIIKFSLKKAELNGQISDDLFTIK